MRPANQPNATAWGGENYFTLPVVHAKTPDGTPVMVSAWELDPEEIAEVQRTGRVWLTITGTVHPPVLLQIRSPFEGADQADGG